MQAFGHKTGSGAPASAQEIALDRKERLRRLAIETVDLSKDPYLHRNHVGKIECRLCLTLHLNEASYLTHTQGRKHQTNLARRAAKEQSLGSMPAPGGGGPGGGAAPKGATPKDSKQGGAEEAPPPPPPSIGRPGYRVTKLRDGKTGQLGFRIEVDYRDLTTTPDGTTGSGSTIASIPRYKFVNSWEQKVEAVDTEWQYVVFAGSPYETIGFKIPSSEIDSKKIMEFWDTTNKIYLLQFLFKNQQTLES